MVWRRLFYWFHQLYFHSWILEYTTWKRSRTRKVVIQLLLIIEQNLLVKEHNSERSQMLGSHEFVVKYLASILISAGKNFWHEDVEYSARTLTRASKVLIFWDQERLKSIADSMFLSIVSDGESNVYICTLFYVYKKPSRIKLANSILKSHIFPT